MNERAAAAAPWPPDAEPSPRAALPDREASRLAFLDAMRGLAALAVACFHLGTVTPLHAPLAHALPSWLMAIFEHGHLAVPVFFALSGFVIAQSLLPADPTPAFLGRFAVRRALRLGPPYWAAILLVVALRAAELLLGREAALPSLGAVIAHAAYLQNILGIPNLVGQFWTLPYEMQFYVVFCGAVVAERALVRRGARPSTAALLLHGGLAGASVAWLASNADAHGWFVREWYSFALGALACWAIAGRVSSWWWILLAAIVTAVALPQAAEFALAAVASSGLILAVGRLGRLPAWGRSGIFRWLSSVSYSLYLTHFVGWAACNALGARFARSPGGAVAFFLCALAGTLLFAEIFRRTVETPSLRLARLQDPLAELRRRMRR